MAVVDEYGSDAERKVLVFNPFVGLKPQSAKFFCNLDGYGPVGARTVDCRMEKSEEEGCDQCETRGGEPWAAPGYDRTMRRAPDDKDDPERRYNDAEGESAVHQWPHAWRKHFNRGGHFWGDADEPGKPVKPEGGRGKRKDRK